jgi:hypothetical protein
LLGLGDEEAFARVTHLGGESFGLAFRGPDADGSEGEEGSTGDGASAQKWQPMLLVDDLANVVEHALVAESALPLRASGM